MDLYKFYIIILIIISIIIYSSRINLEIKPTSIPHYSLPTDEVERMKKSHKLLLRAMKFPIIKNNTEYLELFNKINKQTVNGFYNGFSDTDNNIMKGLSIEMGKVLLKEKKLLKLFSDK